MDWKKIDTIRAAGRATEPPPDSITSADYAAHYGCGAAKARADLAKLTAEGKLKKTIVKIGTALIPHYTTVELVQETDHAPTRRDRARR